MTEEQWKPVLGFEGLYEVSDHGNVRSLPRTIIRSNGRPMKIAARVLRQHNNGHHYGYPLYRDGEKTYRRAHILVLEAFVSPRPTPESCGLHRDDDPTNNHVSNLYWGTMQENAFDRVRNGRDHGARKTHCDRGHLLEAPNLAPWGRSETHRICLACNRALTLSNARGHRGDKPYIAALADEKYRQIMEAPNG